MPWLRRSPLGTSLAPRSSGVTAPSPSPFVADMPPTRIGRRCFQLPFRSRGFRTLPRLSPGTARLRSAPESRFEARPSRDQPTVPPLMRQASSTTPAWSPWRTTRRPFRRSPPVSSLMEAPSLPSERGLDRSLALSPPLQRSPQQLRALGPRRRAWPGPWSPTSVPMNSRSS